MNPYGSVACRFQALWRAFRGFPCSIIYWKLNYIAWDGLSKLCFFLAGRRPLLRLFDSRENLSALWWSWSLREFVKLLLQLQSAKGELTIKTVRLPLRAVWCGFTAHLRLTRCSLITRGDLVFARPGDRGGISPRATTRPSDLIRRLEIVDARAACWTSGSVSFWRHFAFGAGEERQERGKGGQSRYCIPCPRCKQRHALWRDLNLGRKSGHECNQNECRAFVVFFAAPERCSGQIYPRGNPRGSSTIVMSQWKSGKWPRWLMTKASPKETDYYAPLGGGGVGSDNPGEIWHFSGFPTHPWVSITSQSNSQPWGPGIVFLVDKETYSVELF